MLAALVLGLAVSAPQCWDVYDGALRHSAAASHPAFVSYDERIRITEDEFPLVRSRAHIDYRDDGIARVLDERYNFEPLVTRHAEPGPPVIGPYGRNRNAWLPQDSDLPVIADVRSEGAVTCTLAETVMYKGRLSHHLIFSGGHVDDRPGVKEMWIDAKTSDVWKLIVSGPVVFADDPGSKTELADFEVELGYVGPYLLVNHVVWKCRRHEFSQYATYFAEYTMNAFSFPAELPASYFAQKTVAIP